jgi:predicted membrane protein
MKCNCIYSCTGYIWLELFLIWAMSSGYFGIDLKCDKKVCKILWPNYAVLITVKVNS